MTTCQICGRTIKANTGHIAHHGYKRPGNGWQTSSCMGARHLPYEKSCDLIPSVIATIRSYIDANTITLAEFIANPPSSLPYTPYRGAYAVPAPIQVFKPEGFSPTGYRTYRADAYDTLFHNRVYAGEQALVYAKKDLEYLKERLANWKLVE